MARIPDILYKYRQCSKRSFKNLENNVVWCGTLDQYNDPYEGYTTIQFLPVYKAFLNTTTSNHYQTELAQIDNIDELVDFAAKVLRESPEKIKKQILEQEKFQIEHNKSFRDKHIKSTAICSFAEDYDNRLMWSHYAKDYSGFCIGYETEQMKKFLYKVRYKNKIFDITNDIIKIMTKSGDSDFDIKKIKPNQMTIQKDDIWKYEKEWRLINPITRDNVRDFHFDTKMTKDKGYLFKLIPSVIYLGTKISTKDKESLLKVAETQNITVNQMIMNEDNYQLIYKTIYKSNRDNK